MKSQDPIAKNQDNQRKPADTYRLTIEPESPEEFSTLKLSGIRHNAQEHPLLQLDALHELARYLMPREQCRFVDSDLQIDGAFKHASRPADGRSIDEVFASINESGAWVALYNIEAHPQYQQLMWQILESVRPLVEPEQGQILDAGGFVFLSTAPSVTPFHIDRENNFWLQIKGRKYMTVFDWRDDQVVSAVDVENFIVNRRLENVRLREETRERGIETLTSPGQGVFFPATSPHMTRCPEQWKDDGVSISIGVVFYTERMRELARVHQFNNVLRKVGIKPSPPGGGRSDGFKAPIGRLLAGLKRRFRGYRPPPGSY
ncbi:MAG: cupin [Pseudomonadota bacterium]